MDTNGYLLDANHLIPLLRPNDDRRTAILARMAAESARSPMFVATATLAELEVGFCLWQDGDPRSELQAEFRKTIRTNDLNVLDFTDHTAAEYGVLKAALMLKYNRQNVTKNRAKWPEVWTSPDKGATLDGVDEFDLLVVSHAIERNLVLVATDPMLRICDGLDDVPDCPQFVDWISNPTSQT